MDATARGPPQTRRLEQPAAGGRRREPTTRRAANRRTPRSSRRATQRFGDDAAVDGISLTVRTARSSASSARQARARRRRSGMITGALGPDGGGPRAGRGSARASGGRPASGSATCRSSSRCIPTSPRARTSTSSRPCSGCCGVPATADARGPRARRAVGCPRPPGRPPLRRHAAPARARLRAGPRPGPAVPRRADRGHRPDPAGQDLGGASSPARRRADAARDDPVRQRGRVLRHRRADRGRPAHRPRPPDEAPARGAGRRRGRDPRPTTLRPGGDSPTCRSFRSVQRRGPNACASRSTTRPRRCPTSWRRSTSAVARSWPRRSPPVVRRGLREPRPARPIARGDRHRTRRPDAPCSPSSSGCWRSSARSSSRRSAAPARSSA